MNPFEISYGIALLNIEELDIPGRQQYNVHFSNEVPDITIECIKTKAKRIGIPCLLVILNWDQPLAT